MVRLCLALLAAALSASSAAAADVRFADVVKLAGSDLPMFDGSAIDHLGLLACTTAACHPIPFQIDERDPAGRWVLDQGPLPFVDTPAGTLDANDLLLFMAADTGDQAQPGQLTEPASGTRAEIRVYDPLTRVTRYAYLVTGAVAPAPPPPASYVAYDAATDRVRGQRVSLGFADGVPGYLAVGDGTNLLDRLKVRAAATFLFGLIHFTRSEADLRTEFMGWHAGPIRVIRGQRQWVRLGWGIRSPTFGSYTYFYRDFAELPVGLTLNFKPTYFFSDISVQVILDFRDLRGWTLLVPTLPSPLPVDGVMSADKAALAGLSDKWFALSGPEITLVQSMDVSASLATVRRRMLYRETAEAQPPEAVSGELPGIGYRFDQWEQVGAGAHQLQSVSYALPADMDVREFMRARALPLQVSVHSLTGR